MNSPRFLPKIITVFKEGYAFESLLKDAQAGLTVGLVALPLAVAFAIASGVRPEQGMYTAIFAGFTISLLGGSRVQIGGPTGAFIVVVFGIVSAHGYQGLATATFLAGLMLVGMGAAGFGSLIKFIPYPVTIGFTSGIAVLIASSQLRDLFGLQVEAVAPEFIDKLLLLVEKGGTYNIWAVLTAGICAVVTLVFPRITHRIPGPLAGLLAATSVAAVFDFPVETIGSRFPPFSGGLPALVFPDLSLSAVKAVFQPAVTIALLAAIESLLSAVVADGMTGRRHRSDTELIAQGAANMISPLFLGIPATGAIARTATNVKAGGRTPVAGIVHALTILLILLFFGKWSSYLPLSALAAILMIVAYNMSEWRHFTRLLKAPRSDVAVLLTTFALTVLVDLTVAIEVGMVLAAFLFMKRMADVSQARFITSADEEENSDDPMSLSRKSVPDGVEVFEVDGPFFFGAADQFKDALASIVSAPKVLILRLRRVPAIDATGLHVLEDLIEKTSRDGTVLILSGLQARALRVLRRAGLIDRIGSGNVAPDIDRALERAKTFL